MIPFSPPRIDDKIINEVIDTLNSGWITTGPKTKLFEKKLTEYTGCKTTLCLNSATAGLEIMLRWFGVGEGDEVIIPAYTYCATANVIIHCGATPVMVDINKDTFNIDVQKIKKAITKNTKVIIPVDMGGLPCDYDAINNLVNDIEIKNLFIPSNSIQEDLGRILVISDAAHSLGAKYKDKKTGNLTDVSVFSFHAVKNLTTAEGGAIALNLPKPFDNEEIYKYLCVFTLHGQTKDALTKTRGNWKYDVIEAGYKMNMSDVLASIGLVELERYENDTLIKRKNIFDYYSIEFKDYPNIILPIYKNDILRSSYHVYLLRISDITEEQRDEIINEINKRNVAVNVHFQPLPLLTFYKKLGYRMSDYPQSYENYKGEISLPVFYDMNFEMMGIVVSSVKESINAVLYK